MGGGGGGGGAGVMASAVIQTLRKRRGAVSKKMFFGPQFGLKIRRGPAPPGSLPWIRQCRMINNKKMN